MNILDVSDKKKAEYWNHFVSKRAIAPGGFPPNVTGARLRKVKGAIWNDRDFWWDIVLRHGGDKCTPEEMMRDDPHQYGHCAWNFWCGISHDCYKLTNKGEK